MTLHPDIGAFLDLAEQAQLHMLAPEQARALFEQTSRQLAWPAPAIEPLALEAAREDGSLLPLRLYHPATVAPTPVILFFHGGGYVLGSLDSHQGICQELCQRSGFAVVSVGYRLAPEHRFPQPLEDAQQALRWLCAKGSALGLDTTRVAFAGDSVGASLATVLAVQASQPGFEGIRPRLQLLCYPMTDASQRHASRELFAEGYLLEDQTLEWFYECHAREPQDRDDPRFSPLLTEALGNCPPAWIGLAGFDPLLDEGRAYAEKLRSQGGKVELMEYAGLTHDFLRMSSVAPAVLEVYDEMADALKRYLG
ncbi:alpha/beta hydrolase [Phytopseudomonas dryadis]|uniref:Alpha/beta hydrolase n=1 Tax=Phytopseudomonas dryadis TaxID=2487520 RepID=A0ABY1Z326_9GAMM|nr:MULTISPECIES: alpha/beta hydrolase [Pseudomonas]TBU99606.1 alpha/beta hydrolase [Pseudomonas dryadis]TBV12557.1 alpha/beta hydrolase [Pseudomonas sp. FRB 230]